MIFIRRFMVTYFGAAEIFRSETMDRIFREIFKQIGRLIHEKFRPRHFTKEGAREYGYEKRAGEAGGLGARYWKYYTGIKQKKKHHTLPLVYKGEAGGALSLSRMADVVADAKGVKVKYPGLQKLYLKNPKSPIDMVKEFTTFSEAEKTEIENMFTAQYQRLVRRYRGAGKRVIFGS